MAKKNTLNKDIKAYNNSQAADDKAVCNLLAEEITRNLPEAEKYGMGIPSGF